LGAHDGNLITGRGRPEQRHTEGVERAGGNNSNRPKTYPFQSTRVKVYHGSLKRQRAAERVPGHNLESFADTHV